MPSPGLRPVVTVGSIDEDVKAIDEDVKAIDEDVKANSEDVKANMEETMPRRRTAHRHMPTRGRSAAALAALVLAASGAVVPAYATETPGTSPSAARACAPDAHVTGYSDALDKRTLDGVGIGGLSALAYDSRNRAWASVMDHSPSARLWFFTHPEDPRATGTLVLRQPDGTPYGNNFDGEGLTVLPGGDYLVSSETEPSIRIFGRDGVERDRLEVPDRFRVAPDGEASFNATLEGLTVSPDGRSVYAAMEGALSGDAPASGEARDRRILVYRADRHGKYRLDRQIGYQVDAGNRVAEVTAYGRTGLLVLESWWQEGVGNKIKVYGVPDVRRPVDVSRTANLSTVPAGELATKKLVVDVTSCPTGGATNPGPQINPLLDNYEGMAVNPLPGRHGAATLRLISDDNLTSTQVTRLLTLTVHLPTAAKQVIAAH